MDIRAASEQIRGAIEAYLLKDEHGLYKIPFEMQRPIIMLGPPGVGKTAIAAQIAEEMGVNFVSYSITHHTRQSALGLPFIVQREYGGKEYSVSEYTMSEIIAAVYESMEESGVSEGVLFLDEINCVSETLAPAMLQFLQYKTFGQHRMPKGWVIITAGNPPEYNRAAREFDPATLDRLKHIDVEPDLGVWQEYAARNGVHPAITSYLENKPNNFYDVRAGVKGTRMVTARGWEDLSRIIQAYEQLGRKVDYELVRQYLQDDKIAEDFSLYYELFSKYRDDYKISDILAGNVSDSIMQRAQGAPFDERIAIVGLLFAALSKEVRDVMAYEEALRLVRDDIVGLKASILVSENPVELLDSRIAKVRDQSGMMGKWTRNKGDKNVVRRERLEALSKVRGAAARYALSQGAAGAVGAGTANAGSNTSADVNAQTEPSFGQSIFDNIKQTFNGECSEQAGMVAPAVAKIDNSLTFLEDAYGEGEETLVLTTKLSADPVFVKFIGEHGSDKFLKNNEKLLFEERNLSLLKEVEGL